MPAATPVTVYRRQSPQCLPIALGNYASGCHRAPDAVDARNPLKLRHSVGADGRIRALRLSPRSDSFPKAESLRITQVPPSNSWQAMRNRDDPSGTMNGPSQADSRLGNLYASDCLALAHALSRRSCFPSDLCKETAGPDRCGAIDPQAGLPWSIPPTGRRVCSMWIRSFEQTLFPEFPRTISLLDQPA